MPPHRRSTRAATALVAAGALAMSAGMVGLVASSASADQGRMIVVCKNVSTPGGATHHVVIVNENTLNNAEDDAGNPYAGQLPFSWTDAHGQSGQPEQSVATRVALDGEQANDLDVGDECGGGSGSQDECPSLSGPQTPGFECSKSPTERELTGSALNCDVKVRENWKDVYTTVYVFDEANSEWDALAETGPVRLTLPPTALTSEELAACGEDVPDDITVAVSFVDPNCGNLQAASWAGTMGSVVDYTVKGKPGPGRTVTVVATIKPSLAGGYQFEDGAQTSFSHTYPSVDELGCVLGEETIIPKPRPDNEPTRAGEEPTVKGVQVVVPRDAAPRAAVPTAVAAGVGVGPSNTAAPLLAQLLVGGGMLLLLAGGWIGLGRREGGAHEA